MGEPVEIELVFGPRSPSASASGRRTSVTRLTRPEVRVALEVLADGTIRQRSWSLAVAYAVPEARRSTVGADALALLYDGSSWHVQEVELDDDR
jgi:hypothetical protein